MFGFLLGSYCAKLYVDIGYVDMGKRNAFVLEDICTIRPWYSLLHLCLKSRTH